MKKPRIFYGWWILVASFIVVFIYSGVGYYSFQLIWEAIRDDYSWSMASLTASFTIVYATIAISAPFIGRIIDRFGPRKTIAFGAFLVGVGFCLLSQTTNLWYFYTWHVVIGIGMAASGFMPTSTAISNWFSKRRGLALGITMTGIGVGGFVIAPILERVIIPSLGWNYTYYVLAGIIWICVVPIALLVMRDKPQDMGLFPDGVIDVEAVVPPKSASKEGKSWTRPMAMKTATFWIIAVAFGLQSFGNTSVVQNQTRHLNTIFPTGSIIQEQIGIILGIVAIGSTLGKLIFGWLADRIGPKLSSMSCIVCSIVAVGILLSITVTTPMWIIWIYSIIIGLSMGGWASNTPMLISNYFGLKYYGAIYGAANLLIMMGTALGPIVAGAIYDAAGTYNAVFIYALCLSAVAITSVVFLRSPKGKNNTT